MVDIDIVMAGEPRTGKSSVLASVVSSFKQIANATGFRLIQNKDTEYLLSHKKLGNLQQICEDHKRQKTRFPIDTDSTSQSDEYTFGLSYKRGQKAIKIARLHFRDIPGEDMDKPENAEFLKKAHVILIAVDSVHLMEEEGKYSGAFNKPDMLSGIVKNAKIPVDEPRLVLFIPLKCEKYYEEKRMDELTEQVKEEFSSLISYLAKGDLKNSTIVAVTPILTLGCIAFDSFDRNPQGDIILNSQRKPKVFYRYIQGKSFAPKYCEQPVLYILAYSIQATKRKAQQNQEIKSKTAKAAIKVGAGIAGVIVGLCTRRSELAYLTYRWLAENPEIDIKDVPKFAEEYGVIHMHLKKIGDGYEILQNSSQI